MKKKQEQNDVYDSVFDFIFSVQKSGENKPFRKPQPSDGVYASSLMEIGTQPAIYPLESAFNTINGYIEGEMSVNLGDGVSVSLGSVLRGEGSQEIKKKISKNRAEANFARVGGYLHSGIDGALVSLYSKFNGVSAKTAYNAGRLFGDLQRTGKGGISGYMTPKENDLQDEMFAQRGTDLKISSLIQMDARLDKKFLEKAIEDINQYDSYNDRVYALDQRLRMFGIKDFRQRHNLVKQLYGDGKQDLGVYKKLAESERDRLDRVLYNGDKDIKKNIGLFKRADLERKVRKGLGGKDESSRKKNIEKALKDSGIYSLTEASLKASELAKEQTINTGRDIATSAVSSALVVGITKGSTDYIKIAKAENKVQSLLLKQSGQESLGSKIERRLLLSRWIANSGKGDILLEGNWEKFGVDDLNFTKIMERQVVKDEKGKIIGSYYVPAKSVMGKLIGSAYYFHPNNLIRGLFLDGSLWLKWASRGGQLNKRSFAYFAYQARLGKIFSMMAKPFNFITTGMVKVLNPFVQGIKKFAKNFLKRMIGATGVGGWIVNKLMDVLGDKLQEFVAQAAQAALLGVVAILLIFLISTGSVEKEKQVEGIMSPKNTEQAVASVSDKAFTAEDFFSPESEDLEKDKEL